MKRLLFLLFLPVLLFPASSRSGQQNLVQPSPVKVMAPSLASQVLAKDNKFLIWQEAKQVNVSEDGKMDARLKEDTSVPRGQFFDRYRTSLKLGKDDQMVETKNFQDKSGMVQSRFFQSYKGIEVLGSGYVLREKQGAVDYAAGRIATGLDLDTTPQISESQALDAALNDIGAETYAWKVDEKASPPKGRLAIASKDYAFAKDSLFRLVWQFEIESWKPFESYTVEVDAKKIDDKTGEAEIVNKFSNWVDVNADGEGETFYDGKKPIVVDKYGKEDPTLPYEYRLKKEGLPDIEVQRLLLDPPKIEDIVNDSNYFSDEKQRAGVSALWAVEQSIKFYAEKSPWEVVWLGWDGNGKEPVSIFLFPPSIPQIGGYDSNKKRIGLLESEPSPAAPDIVGHEYTHGVIMHLLGNFPLIGEKAALNEGFADIMGTLIKFYARGSLDWCYGGEFYEKKKCMRLLNDPKVGGVQGPQPQTYKGPRYLPTDHKYDHTSAHDHPHKNSSVLTYWFYLLVQGGSGVIEREPGENSEPYKVLGLGVGDASKIAMRTMFYLPPDPTFADVRKTSLLAAEIDFGKGSDQYAETANAWHAVGVGPKSMPDRKCDPPMGAVNVEGWTAVLRCQIFLEEGEVDWEFQVSPSPNFDKDVKTAHPNAVSPGPGQPTVAVTFNLDGKTPYFWRMKVKTKPAQQAPESDGMQRAEAPASGGSRAENPGLIQKARGFLGGLLTSRREKTETLVRVQGGDQWRDWSQTYFITTASKAPVLKYPSAGSTTVHPWGAELSWNSPDPKAEGAVVQVSQTPGAWDNALEKQAKKGETTVKFDLKKGTDYYWRAMALGPESTKGDWSSGVKFTTTVPKAALDSPGDNATISPWGIQLIGNKVVGAEKYRVVVTKNLANLPDAPEQLDPSKLVFDSGVTGAPTASVPPGQSNASYSWGIYPYDQDAKEWGTTQVRSFTVDYQWTKPIPLWPRNSAPYIGYKQSMNILWQPVLGAVQYKVSIYDRVNNTAAGPPFLPEILTPGYPTTFEGNNVLYQGNNPINYASTKHGYCYRIQAFGKDQKGMDLPGVPGNLMCYDVAPPKPQATGLCSFQKNIIYPTPIDWKCDSCKEYKIDTYVVKWAMQGGSFTSFNTPNTTAYLQTNPSTGYVWFVCAVQSNIPSCFDYLCPFTTGAPKPPPQQQQQQQQQGGQVSAPSLICPLDEVTYFVSTPFYKFKWSKVSGATNYLLTVYTTYFPYENLTQVFQQEYGDVSESPPIEHSPQIVYRWEIRAKQGNGPWSAPTLSEVYTAVYGPGHPKAILTKCYP